MTTGLHRDPAAAPDISVFEGEQRRRLWITIVEMDLQISMNCGMPSMTRVADFGWCVPSNVDDVDLFEEMTSLPMGKSSDEWTDSLCQVTLATSLQWRLEATDHVNNIGGEVDYQEQVDYCRNAEELLRDLPPILKYDHIWTSSWPDQTGRVPPPDALVYLPNAYCAGISRRSNSMRPIVFGHSFTSGCF